MMRGAFKIVMGLLLISVIGCTNSNDSESAGEYIDSSATTAKVKASLVDDLGSSGFDVKVKTYKDVVQLSGFVDTLQIKNRAGMIASGVPGVKNVSNDIVVKSR